MPPNEPPPRKKPGTRGKSDAPAPRPASEDAEIVWARILGSRSHEEVDVAWPEGAALDTTEAHGDASAFERVTIAPPVPEREYVARMMRKAMETNPVPGAPQAHPPSARTSDDDRATENRPTPVHGLAPLVLDLTDSLRPEALLSYPVAEPAPSHPVAAAAADAHSALAFAPNVGAALDLVAVQASSIPPHSPTVATIRDVRDRMDVGDFSGALSAAEALLDADPANTEASSAAEHCRAKLKQMYIARLGGLKRTPHVTTTPEQLRWLALDHRAGFLLSLVDGRSTLDEVLDVSGMAELDALRLLIQLLQQNVLKVD